MGGVTGAGAAGFGSTQTSAADDEGEATVDDDTVGTTPLRDEAAVRLPQPATISDSAATKASRVRIDTPFDTARTLREPGRFREPQPPTAPSTSSRMRSAWPLCRAYSSIMWT